VGSDGNRIDRLQIPFDAISSGDRKRRGELSSGQSVTGRANEPRYFGWLCNSVPGYPEAQHFKTAVHSRNVGVRPYIELEATDHQLGVEQRNGITAERVRQIAEQMHHHTSKLAELYKCPTLDTSVEKSVGMTSSQPHLGLAINGTAERRKIKGPAL
jgi:hypothetical protein